MGSRFLRRRRRLPHCLLLDRNSIALPIIKVLRGFLISRSARFDDFLIERCCGRPRSRTAVGCVCDARALRGGFFAGGKGRAVGHARALLAVAREGDAADLEGRVDGDGVLAHDPPDAAASHVEVEVVPDPLDLLAADEQRVAVVLVLANSPLALPCPTAVAAANRVHPWLCSRGADVEEGREGVFLGQVVPVEEGPGLGGGRFVVVDDEAGEWVRLAADARQEVELDDLLVVGSEVDAGRVVVTKEPGRRHGVVLGLGRARERERDGGERLWKMTMGLCVVL
jgi:hypothetical protein